jgi:quercetin dioxygenase-like cupin family protein
MSLLAKWDDIQNSGPEIVDKFHSKNEFKTTKRVYGNDGSLMVATSPAGYHSYPHKHISEQLSYCLEGEVWIFVGEEGFLLQKGDFHRVPPNQLHWAWNRSDQGVTLVESHTPRTAFPDEPDRQGRLVALFSADEVPQLGEGAPNIFEDGYASLQQRVEERIFGSAYATSR